MPKSTISTRAAGLALGSLAIAALTAGAADAAACRARIDGEGRGQGVAGLGTEVAKTAAANNWAQKVEARYGARFSDIGRAQAVRYSCRNGLVLEVKCVVSAKPCRS